MKCYPDCDGRGKMLSLAELVKWTGVAVFELWLHALGLIVFSFMLALKLCDVWSISYWWVFLPLFTASVLDGYFLFICFIRGLIAGKDVRIPPSISDKAILNWLRCAMITTFEALLCYKMDGDLEHGQVAVKSSYGMVFVPIWTLILLLLFQACRIV